MNMSLLGGNTSHVFPTTADHFAGLICIRNTSCNMIYETSCKNLTEQDFLVSIRRRKFRVKIDCVARLRAFRLRLLCVSLRLLLI